MNQPATCLERIADMSHQEVTVFLTNGVRLFGSVTEVLDDGFMLTYRGVTQVIFGHAVATTIPGFQQALRSER